MDYLPAAILLGILIILTIIHRAGKNKKPLLRAFISMAIGIASMIAVNITSFATGVNIPVSLFTMGVSAGLGVPGVTLLLFINLL